MCIVREGAEGSRLARRMSAMMEYMTSHLGHTLLIANPTSQNGKGAAAAYEANRLLCAQGIDAECVLTEHAGHAADIAASASERGVRTVIALGGDGVIHEAVNGIMRLARDRRPALGVIPVGSGNDFARTVGMSEKLERAIVQLAGAQTKPFDIGCVNGVYFMETLSFGVDAAIALDTVERRKRTGKTGTLLYLEAGIDQLFHHLHTHRFEAKLFDGTSDGRVVEGEFFLMAVQIGRTYGGGFAVCPDARVDDGLFDICLARAPLSVPKGTFIFLLAKNGHHTRFKAIEFYRAPALEIRVEGEVAVQVDGEPLVADVYRIETLPAAIDVLVPQGR